MKVWSIRWRLAALVGAMILITSAGVWRVHRRQTRVKLGYELSEARAELSRLQEQDRQLRLEVAVLTDPERVESVALAMGMVRPQAHQVRRARDRPRAEGDRGLGGTP